MGPMRTQLTFAPLAGIETELLAVLAADTQTAKGPDAKPFPVLLTSDSAVEAAGNSRPAPMKRCCCTRRPA